MPPQEKQNLNPLNQAPQNPDNPNLGPDGNKKVLLISLAASVVILLAMLVYFVAGIKPADEKENVTTETSVNEVIGIKISDLENITIDDESLGVAQPIVLNKGLFSNEKKSDKDDSVIEEMSTVRIGNITISDVDNDGKAEGFGILNIGFGGTGMFKHLAYFKIKDARVSYVSSVSIGDRVVVNSISVEDGFISVDIVGHGPNDPLCCPSVEKTLVYKLVGEKLIEGSRDNSVGVYKNDTSGLQFQYPKVLSLSEDDGIVTLRHSVSHRHVSECDFKGSDKPRDDLVDFNVSFEIIKQNLKNYVQSTEFPGWEYVSKNPYKYGVLNGYKVTQGIEGCGYYTYYFGISDTETLIVNRTIISELNYSQNKDEYLALPNIISPTQEEKYLDKIMSTLKFANYGIADSADWKTYKDDDYGFAFKYPSKWRISTAECSKGTCFVDENNNDVLSVFAYKDKNDNPAFTDFYDKFDYFHGEILDDYFYGGYRTMVSEAGCYECYSYSKEKLEREANSTVSLTCNRVGQACVSFRFIPKEKREWFMKEFLPKVDFNGNVFDFIRFENAKG